MGNDRSNDFMISFPESHVAALEFNLVTPGSAVRWAFDCNMEPGYINISVVREMLAHGQLRIYLFTV